jgi:hypothetical protein
MITKRVIKNLRTIGAFILYQDTLVFMIGPDYSGRRLGIIRLGGHIESEENYLDALNREIKEEASIEVKLVNSTHTYYMSNWLEESYIDITNQVSLDIKPLVIVKDVAPSTAIFLAYADSEPKPASEASGLIFLKLNELRSILKKHIKLKEFISNGGKVIINKKLDENLEIAAGVHLHFLYKLINDKNQLIFSFLNGELK